MVEQRNEPVVVDLVARVVVGLAVELAVVVAVVVVELDRFAVG